MVILILSVMPLAISTTNRDMRNSMPKLSKRVPSTLKDKYQQIEKLIVEYSKDNLDEDYREYCLFLTAAGEKERLASCQR